MFDNITLHHQYVLLQIKVRVRARLLQICLIFESDLLEACDVRACLGFHLFWGRLHGKTKKYATCLDQHEDHGHGPVGPFSGTDFLTASSLSDFWTSISGVFVSDSVLGSLCGQAYGAKNYDMVGTWLQISWTLCPWAAIPVFRLWCETGPVLRYGLGTEQGFASYAAHSAIVPALCMPARMISGNLSIFLNAQKVTGPSSQTIPIAVF